MCNDAGDLTKKIQLGFFRSSGAWLEGAMGLLRPAKIAKISLSLQDFNIQDFKIS